MRPRVGVIGAGFIGAFHARGVSGLIKLGLVDADYVAVCDLEPERAQEFARIAGVDRWTADPDEVIGADDINTIYVCTPTAGHKALVVKSAAAGKHVFCEKPLARSLSDAREMHEAVRSAGVRHQVGLILRHAPIFIALRELIDDPKLGRLMTAVFRDDQFFPTGGQYRSDWRADASITGGGTLIEHSIHDLDVLTYLCGDVASVQADTRNFAGHAGVEDLTSATLRFASGATGQLTSVWHQLADKPASRLLELFFERGYFRVDDDFFGAIHYETADSGGPQTIADDEVRRRYLERVGLTDDIYDQALGRYSLEDYWFLRAIAEERDAAPGFDVAVRAHELVDAIYRSAAEDGATVAVSG